MYKANQEALIQATNQGLIGIRQTEINYYVSVNTAFGTQAALIGGFTYGIFLQNQESGNFWTHHMQTSYYVCASTTIASAITVIILTMLVQVLAPGLALNGPVGSMARATEGMRAEQNIVMIAFGLMMFSFACATVLAFWIVMDIYGALGSSFVFLVAVIVWYVYINRILARFSFDHSRDMMNWEEFNDRSDEPGRASSCDLTDENRHINAITRLNDTTALSSEEKQRVKLGAKFMNVVSWLAPGSTKRGDNNNSNNNNKNDKNDGVIEMDSFTNNNNTNINTTNSSKGGNAVNSKAPNNSNSNIVESVVYNPAQMNSSNKQKQINCTDVAMEGYMTKRVVSRGKIFVKDSWQRCYFVLNYRGEIYYYKNRLDFRSIDHVSLRLEGRPIELDDYLVKYYNSEPKSDSNFETNFESNSDAESGNVNSTAASAKHDNDREDCNVCDTLSVNSHNTHNNQNKHKSTRIAPVFQFTLVPLNGHNLLHYGLRCDTQEEFVQWLEIMQNVSLTTFESRESVAK